MKRKTKRAYKAGEIGITDAMAILMFDCGMDFTPASEYLNF